MVDPDALQSLADAIGVHSSHDLDIIAKTLSYLGVTSSPVESRHHQALLSISIKNEAQCDQAFQARFDAHLKAWCYGPLQNVALHSMRTLPPAQDWTELLPRALHVDFLKSRDWASTALGPMSSWSTSLQLMTMKMLSDPGPANLYVGPDRVAVYNEPFSIVAASRHPFMMGATCEAALPATWPFLSLIFDNIERTGAAFSAGNFEMSVEKIVGFLGEAWYDGVFSRDVDGRIFALYNSGFEITDSVMSLRRSRILHMVTAEPDFDKVTPWQYVIDVGGAFDRDLPLLMLYSAVENSPASDRCSLHLEGYLGLSESRPAIPTDMDLYEGSSSLVSVFRQVKANKRHILLDHTKDGLPDFLAGDIEWRGHGNTATHTIVAPRFVTGLLAGFLVMAFNPRPPYDNAHCEFIDDFVRSMSGLLASNLSFEQARVREERLTEQLTAHEKFLSKVAEVVTVGVARHSHEGLITWANSKYWEITGISNKPEDVCRMSGFDRVPGGARLRAEQAFSDAVSQQTTITREFPLARKWRPPESSKDEPAWVLVSLTGEPTSVLGCVTDISHLKWTEKLQAQVAEDAKEAKRQQEKFMDMTSHELRNPLSAILQCADDILTTCQGQNANSATGNRAFEGMEESARTILFCAAHQQRVINDILTVSKLDSSLLEFSPIAMNASTIVDQALRMYKSELVSHNIAAHATEKLSFVDLQIEYVFCDPSRLTQILINLFTNAIKFTKSADRREIRVQYGALASPPSDKSEGLHWFPSERERRQSDLNLESKLSKKFYLGFEIQDTGEGISKDEMSQLFKRFSQASPMTHVKYGGSGLGLFISRELTELQGGMMGAKSELKKGTTFAFYIETRLATDLEREELHSSLHGGAQNNSMPASPVLPHPMREATYPENDTSARVKTKNTRRASVKNEMTLSVLLVEDNILNQNILKRQLQRLGCTVYFANHGAEALDFLKATRFWHENAGSGHDIDFVLMDWEMPVMDGLSSTRQLCDWEASGQILNHLTVLGTTVNGRSGQVEIALAAGMDDVIAKPFTVSSLMARIKALRTK